MLAFPLWILLGLGIAGYTVVVLVCWRLWKKLPQTEFSASAYLPAVTVVVVARNEAPNIHKLLDALKNQDYPAGKLELLLADDGSTDGTADLASAYAQKIGLPYRSFRVNVGADFVGGHKKVALMQAAELSRNELFFLTDADCQPGRHWISSHIAYHQSFGQAKLVFGNFLFAAPGHSWLPFLNLEALCLAGVSAVSNHLAMPTMCSGANLSCRRELLSELKPYENNLQLASGDDEFLLHSLSVKYPGSSFFNTNKEATVATAPPASFLDFFYQRRRWSGKWKKYELPWPRRLAVIIFTGNLGALVCIVSLFAGFSLPAVSFLMLKAFADGLLSARLCHHYRQKHLLKFFISMEIIYPFYAVFFGIASNFGKYQWKGRRYP